MSLKTVNLASRLGTLPALLHVASIALLLCSAQVQAFSLDDVAAKAEALGEKNYSAPVSNLPVELSEMPFADYQKIQPRPEAFEWRERDTPFKLGSIAAVLQAFPNALACAMATARHGDSSRLETARQRLLQHALLWQQAEQHPLWRHAYHQAMQQPARLPDTPARLPLSPNPRPLAG